MCIRLAAADSALSITNAWTFCAVSFGIYARYSLSLVSTRCRSWLRHYATSQKIAGSIPDAVIGIFH